MTTEILEKANELNKKIVATKSHLDYVKKAENYYGIGATMYVTTSSSNLSSRNLLTYLLPISIEDFMNMYIAKTEKHLKQLEEDFENLKSK